MMATAAAALHLIGPPLSMDPGPSDKNDSTLNLKLVYLEGTTKEPNTVSTGPRLLLPHHQY